jgi:NADH dehydrogenase
VTLSDGEFVPTHTLMWCVGVRPDPLAADIGNCTDQGRILVDEYLGVPGQPDVFAAGDAAAVPDLTRPGEYTAMTAQHAVRQGKLAGRNVAASLRGRKPRRYKHHDLGFVVDLGAGQAAANPLRIPLSGFPAKMVTRGYHLLSMPGNRIRTATEWLMDYAVGRQTVQLGLVRGPNVPLDSESPETPRMFTGSYADSGSAGSDATGSKTERADRG